MQRTLFRLSVFFSGIVGWLGAAEPLNTPVEVKKALADGKAVLIDVREADEWKDGHLKDAKNLPLSELKAGVTEEKLKAIFPKGKVAYLHCAAGVRSAKAAEILLKQGYDVRPLKEGYEALLKAGLPKAE
jgi:phage shock protein E